jgi:hypothetical protein
MLGSCAFFGQRSARRPWLAGFRAKQINPPRERRFQNLAGTNWYTSMRISNAFVRHEEQVLDDVCMRFRWRMHGESMTYASRSGEPRAR